MQRIHNISGPSKHPSQAPSRSRNKGPFRIVISEKEADAVPLGGRNWRRGNLSEKNMGYFKATLYVTIC